MNWSDAQEIEVVTCSKCESTLIHAKGLCFKHYQQHRYHTNKKLIKRYTECTIEGCHGKHKALGMCAKHYSRDYYLNNNLPKKRYFECIIDGCHEKHKALGMCKKHYSQDYRKIGE